MNQSRLLRSLNANRTAEEDRVAPGLPGLPSAPAAPMPNTREGERTARQELRLPDPEAQAEPIRAAEGSLRPSSCPKCSHRLIDPQGMGWCQKCGYFHAQADEQIKPVTSEAQPATGVAALKDAVGKVPPWAYALVCGVIFVGVTTVLARLHFTKVTPFQLAMWCTVQIGVSLLLLFVAQVWAVCLVAAEDQKLGPQHIFLAGPLWVTTCKQLPRTRGPVWLGACCLAAIAAALIVVGGLGYWLDQLPGAGKDRGKQGTTRR